MTLSPQLLTLGRYLAGEFENHDQAQAEPAWYVHLRLWLRPVPLFTADSVTLFAEQANVLKLDQPYRQRLLRLRRGDSGLQVEFYQLREPRAWQGGGVDPDRLVGLPAAAADRLTDCTLAIAVTGDRPETWEFRTLTPPDYRCHFCYQGQQYTVFLGFAVSATALLTYDKGLDPETGRATWGALLGPYRLTRRQSFAADLPPELGTC